MKPSQREFEAMALGQLDTLYRVARRLARNEAQAEDLVQETYLRALRSRETFDLKSYGIKPWLIRIMRNAHLSRVQREGHETGAEPERLEQVSDGRGPPLPADSFEGMDERLVEAVKRLPEEYQTVLTLWALEDLSYKEIAVAAEVPIGTVMSRLHRARQRLMEELRELAAETGLRRRE